MQLELLITYTTSLKYKTNPTELMELRYSTEASDRVNYEMIILSAIRNTKIDAGTALDMPQNFSNFIEQFIQLPKDLVREKMFRLIKM